MLRPALVEATAQGIAWLAAGKPSGWHKQGKIDYFSSKATVARQNVINERYQKFVSILQSN